MVALLGCPASVFQFVRQDGTEELRLLGTGGHSPREPWEWPLRHRERLTSREEGDVIAQYSEATRWALARLYQSAFLGITAKGIQPKDRGEFYFIEQRRQR